MDEQVVFTQHGSVIKLLIRESVHVCGHGYWYKFYVQRMLRGQGGNLVA